MKKIVGNITVMLLLAIWAIIAISSNQSQPERCNEEWKFIFNRTLQPEIKSDKKKMWHQQQSHIALVSGISFFNYRFASEYPPEEKTYKYDQRRGNPCI